MPNPWVSLGKRHDQLIQANMAVPEKNNWKKGWRRRKKINGTLIVPKKHSRKVSDIHSENKLYRHIFEKMSQQKNSDVFVSVVAAIKTVKFLFLI
jgi:hypothetical protein